MAFVSALEISKQLNQSKFSLDGMLGMAHHKLPLASPLHHEDVNQEVKSVKFFIRLSRKKPSILNIGEGPPGVKFVDVKIIKEVHICYLIPLQHL
jgi:hypothetical protein